MVVQAGLRLVGNKVRKGATADEVDALLEEILKRTQNAEALTAQLLAFSRKQELRPVAVDVNERVRSVCSMLAQTLGSTGEIRTDLHEKAGEAELDADQLESALLNLAVNARDAMGGFGTLTIQTDIAGQSGDLRDRADLLRVTVRDTGSGMDPETKAKAFEPFFTSKGEGKGTGLGLSQVYGFVVQSGGHVRIDSEVGVGTEVHMFLPRNARAQKNPWSAEARPPIARGSPNG
jgi:signal transduction histidine kinase